MPKDTRRRAKTARKNETPPKLGHNSGAGIPEEGNFLSWVAQIERLKSAADVARKNLQTARKSARADGVKLKLLDWALQTRELNREDASDNVAHFAAYLRYLKAPIGTQFEFKLDTALDDDLSDEEIESRVTADALSNGMLAGLRRADPSENPHDANMPAGQAWLKGYHDGIAAANREVEPLSEEDTDDLMEEDDEDDRDEDDAP